MALPVWLCALAVSPGGLSQGHSIRLKSNLCCPLRADCPCMQRQSVLLRSQEGGSHARNFFLLRGTRCEVPVAVAACHMWDRWTCSCPVRFASQRSTRQQLGCSQGIRPLPEGLCSPVGIWGRWKSIVLDVGDVLGRCGGE